MTEQQVFDLRKRIAEGEEITEEELREAIKAIAQERSAKQNKPRKRASDITDEEIEALL